MMICIIACADVLLLHTSCGGNVVAGNTTLVCFSSLYFYLSD